VVVPSGTTAREPIARRILKKSSDGVRLDGAGFGLRADGRVRQGKPVVCCG